MVVFDATFLIYLFDHKIGTDVAHVQKKIEFLVKTLNKRKEKIIVPTPALSELLVRAGEAEHEYLEKLGNSAVFKIVGFDQRAAVEVAATTLWSKVKFDLQIIAIAKVEGASAIYSDDYDIVRILENSKIDIDVVRICDLPLPSEMSQMDLDIPPKSKTDPS